MKSAFLFAVACLLVVSALAGVARKKSRAAGVAPHGILSGPSNVAMLFGPLVTLSCTVEVTGNERVQWWEYVTNPSGAQITDVTVILPGHPNVIRYSLDFDQAAGTYNLVISPTVLADGGYYQCVDANAVPPATQKAGAQVVMILTDPNCTSTLPADGIVLEGNGFTSECIMHFQASSGVEPLMTWTGPEPFNTVITYTNTSVWSGIGFTATRNIDADMFTCTTNFTDQGFNSPDSATNIPTYTDIYRTQQVFVHWPPKNMYIEPKLVIYSIGMVVTCFADAYPAPRYTWQSINTLEKWYSQSVVLREDMVGNQTMRCNAVNWIQSIRYTQDLFEYIYVKPNPTTPTPGVSTTTTAAPAEEDCSDLSGRWEAADPKAIMCIWLDLENNGVLMGLFKNGTDTYYADIYGRAQVNTYDQGGFSAIWPSTMGVSGHVLECKKCYGVEIMKVSQIIRSEESADACGDVGVTHQLPEFTFNRVTNEPPCTSAPPTFY